MNTVRRVLTMEVIVFEDGNVEIATSTRDKKNLLGRKNHILNTEEQEALLFIIQDKLQEIYPQQVRIEHVEGS